MNISQSPNKLRAFTLLELLVGMIVSGIVLTAVWTSWNIVARCTSQFLASVQQAENSSLFLSRLSEDYYLADSISVTGNNLLFVTVNHTVAYQPGDDYVVRVMNDHADTFPVTVIHTEINSGNLNMEVDMGGQRETIVFSRPFSSAESMKNQ